MRAALVWLVGFAASGCSEYQIKGPPGDPPPVASSPTEPAPSVDAPEPSDEAPPLSEPIADAGDDQDVEPLDTIVLDGTRSYDPDGREIVEMEWSLVSAPPGSDATLADPTRPKPEFLVDLAGEYVFELTVMNDAGVWDPTPDTVTIVAVPLDGFYVQLTWDAATDLDLHLLNGGSDLFETGDCNYCNTSPRWGAPGTADDPSLDRDDTNGYGPETITIDDPADDVYTAAVHFFGGRNSDDCRDHCDPSVATVRVFLSGVEVAAFSRELTTQDDVWTVASITWPTGAVAEIDALDHTTIDNCWQ